MESTPFKIVLVGNAKVGKSALTKRLTEDSFSPEYVPSMATEQAPLDLKIDGETVSIILWDTACAHRTQNQDSTSFYRGTKGVIIVYDITDDDSFRQIDDWVYECDRFVKEATDKLVIGNKCDLDGQRQVEKDTAQDYVQEHDFLWMETSCSSGTGVHDALELLVRAIKERVGRVKVPTGGTNNRRNVPASPPPSKGCCTIC